MSDHEERAEETGPAQDAPPHELAPESGDYFPTFRRMGRAVLGWRGFRTLRRAWKVVLKGLLLLLIILALAHVGATVYLGARLKAELRKLAASGGVVNFMDGIPPPVPEDQNAAPLDLKAAQIIEDRDKQFFEKQGRPGDRGERYDIDFSQPVDLARLSAMVRQDADVLELLRRATLLPKCRFDTNWEDVLGALFPHYAKMRRVARFLRTATIEAALRGDPTEALDRARIGFILSRRMLGEPVLIAQLVAWAIDGIVARGVMCVVERGVVPEDAARRLAEEIAKDDLIAAHARAMQMERAAGLWAFEQMRRRPVWVGTVLGNVTSESGLRLWLWKLWGNVGRPLLYANELVYLDYMEQAIQAAKLPWREGAWRQVRDAADKMPWWAPLVRALAPLYSGVGQKRDRVIAARAMLVTALAIEVYRQRTGHLPASLVALKAEVPWAMTQDVFSGHDLIYRPRDGGYLLYSIGPNLKDDGGKPLIDQKRALGQVVPQVVKDPNAGDLVWLPQLWRSKPRS